MDYSTDSFIPTEISALLKREGKHDTRKHWNPVRTFITTYLKQKAKNIFILHTTSLFTNYL